MICRLFLSHGKLSQWLTLLQGERNVAEVVVWMGVKDLCTSSYSSSFIELSKVQDKMEMETVWLQSKRFALWNSLTAALSDNFNF